MGKYLYKKHKRLYQVWAGIKARCYNKNHKSYKNYGGRGIFLCDEWLSFERFLGWSTATGYRHGLTIDRINNDKGYSPANCQWSTVSNQNRNRRSTILTQKLVDEIRSKYKSGKVTQKELAAEYGVSRSHVSNIAGGRKWV